MRPRVLLFGFMLAGPATADEVVTCPPSQDGKPFHHMELLSSGAVLEAEQRRSGTGEHAVWKISPCDGQYVEVACTYQGRPDEVTVLLRPGVRECRSHGSGNVNEIVLDDTVRCR